MSCLDHKLPEDQRRRFLLHWGVTDGRIDRVEAWQRGSILAMSAHSVQDDNGSVNAASLEAAMDAALEIVARAANYRKGS